MSRSTPERTKLVQGSAAWHAWRRTGVGSSDISVLTGDAPWGDPVTLFQEKLGYAAPVLATASMEAGQWLEDLIAHWYAKKTERRVRVINYGLRSREHPFAIASPDRAVPGRGLLEVKIADHPGDAWGKPGTDQVPDRVVEQALWQAEVAGVEVVDVAVFFTRTRRREVYSVGHDPAIVTELLAFGADFWRCVETRTPPEPVERRLHLPLREDEIEADEELTSYTLRYLAAKDDLGEMEEELEAAKELLKMRLDQVGGARGDGFRIHYRPNADSTIVAWDRAAIAYRQRLVDAGVPEAELDQVIADLTSTKQGARPLVVRRQKERTDRAAA